MTKVFVSKSQSLDWINHHHFYYFWVVCRLESFSRAAEALLISQSAISEQVKRFEDSLGQKLIERGRRQAFRLTEPGRIAFQYAETVFPMTQEMAAVLRRGAAQSTLRVGAVSSLSRNMQIRFLEPALNDPDLKLKVRVGSREAMLEDLREHHLDFILSDSPLAAGERDGFISQELFRSPYCLVGSKKLATSLGRSLKKLAGVPLLYLASPSSAHLHLIHDLEEQGVRPNLKAEFEDVALLRLAALEGLAVAFIPKIGVVKGLESGRLHLIHEFKTIQEPFYVISRQRRLQNPWQNRLIESFEPV